MEDPTSSVAVNKPSLDSIAPSVNQDEIETMNYKDLDKKIFLSETEEPSSTVNERMDIVPGDNEEGDNETLSHKDLIEVTKTTLNQLIQRDLLLSDLPTDVSVEEVKAQIALEHGQSMKVYVVRGDGEELPVVVKHKGATVLDLKRAIKRHMAWRMARQNQSVKISWKYIWKTYHLKFESERLTRDETLLAEIGIKNRSTVTFVKRKRIKGAPEEQDKSYDYKRSGVTMGEDELLNS